MSVTQKHTPRVFLGPEFHRCHLMFQGLSPIAVTSRSQNSATYAPHNQDPKPSFFVRRDLNQSQCRNSVTCLKIWHIFKWIKRRSQLFQNSPILYSGMQKKNVWFPSQRTRGTWTIPWWQEYAAPASNGMCPHSESPTKGADVSSPCQCGQHF